MSVVYLDKILGVLMEVAFGFERLGMRDVFRMGLAITDSGADES